MWSNAFGLLINLYSSGVVLFLMARVVEGSNDFQHSTESEPEVFA